MFPKNQTRREEHITFIDEEHYLAHCAVSNKQGETVSTEVVNVLEEKESKSTVKIMASDGEPGNIFVTMLHIGYSRYKNLNFDAHFLT